MDAKIYLTILAVHSILKDSCLSVEWAERGGRDFGSITV